MYEMALSSTSVSLGPEGILVGGPAGYSPPADLAQVGDALNLVRRDLREIGAAFKVVYELKVSLEAKIAERANRLNSRIDALDKTTDERIRTGAIEVGKSVGALQEQFGRGLTELTLKLSMTEASLLGRARLADDFLQGIAAESARIAAVAEEKRLEDREAADQRARDFSERLDKTSYNLADALASSETKILNAVSVSVGAESRAIALQFIAADQKATRLHGEILSAIKAAAVERAKDRAQEQEAARVAREQLRSDVMGELEDARQNAWPILWASLKAALKGAFKRKRNRP